MGNQDSLTIQVHQVCMDVETAAGRPRRILHPVSVQITEQMTAVIGSNGSGKSTLLRLVAGLVEPTAGTVRFSPASPRTGFVFANPQAQMVMPVVGEDIAFSLKQAGVPRAERKNRAASILSGMELEHLMDSSVYELSSGERQKVALAGVIAADPQLILADEPTTLLDLRSAAEFQSRLLGLGVPLVIATHDLDFAAQAQRVLVFDDGRLVADDEPPAAIAHYRRLALS